MPIPPNTVTGSGSINLVSNATYQFAVWYDLASELHIGRITRGTHTWGVNHQEYTFAGAPRTALGLPASADEHDYPVIAVDGLGRLHVWANMHNEVFRAVKTTDPHTSDTWLATAGWSSAAADFPSVEVSCTYPTPTHLADGTIWFYLRDDDTNSLSGQADSHYWTRAPAGTTWSVRTFLFQGISVTDAGGPGVPGSPTGTDDITNWSAYPTLVVVESPWQPHPGRMHMGWAWREFGLTEINFQLSYAYSDDNGATWKAIDGTTLTLPITPLNNLAARLPGSAMIRSISRTSNVVTAVVDTAAHGIVVGDSCLVAAAEVGYNGTFTVTGVLTGPNRITWAQVAADDAAGGVGSITRVPFTSISTDLTIDDSGWPHLIIDDNDSDTQHIYYDGDRWLQEFVPNPLNGLTRFRGGGAFWHRDKVWILQTGEPSHARRARLWELPLSGATGGGTVIMGGQVGTTSQYLASGDPEAYRRFGTIEVLVPDGDSPRVFVFGRGTRGVAA